MHITTLVRSCGVGGVGGAARSRDHSHALRTVRRSTGRTFRSTPRAGCTCAAAKWCVLERPPLPRRSYASPYRTRGAARRLASCPRLRAPVGPRDQGHVTARALSQRARAQLPQLMRDRFNSSDYEELSGCARPDPWSHCRRPFAFPCPWSHSPCRTPWTRGAVTARRGPARSARGVPFTHTKTNKHAWMRLPADPKRGAREAHVHLADAKGGGLSPL